MRSVPPSRVCSSLSFERRFPYGYLGGLGRPPFGATDRDRTGTVFLPRDFKSLMPASYITVASRVSPVGPGLPFIMYYVYIPQSSSYALTVVSPSLCRLPLCGSSVVGEPHAHYPSLLYPLWCSLQFSRYSPLFSRGEGLRQICVMVLGLDPGLPIL